MLDSIKDLPLDEAIEAVVRCFDHTNRLPDSRLQTIGIAISVGIYLVQSNHLAENDMTQAIKLLDEALLERFKIEIPQ